MKEYIRQAIAELRDDSLARALVREYLQARVLEGLQEDGTFADWALVGGTGLRFLYNAPRFSEDLDFSLKTAGTEDRFEVRMTGVKNRFAREGYRLQVKAKTRKTVKSAFLKFEGLLYDVGLSPLPAQTISIKVEIDTNPPDGAGFETSIVRRHVLLNLLHYDKSSLLAGKLHALLTRKYVKGRDVYDLMWYLSDGTWPGPNLAQLNNALAQTGWPGPWMTPSNWRQEIKAAVSRFDWDKVLADVGPFVEKKRDLEILTREAILKLLGE